MAGERVSDQTLLAVVVLVEYGVIQHNSLVTI